MGFDWNIDRVIQLVGYIFDVKGSRQLNTMAVLKLLYISDRESLRERGYPLTGDDHYALEYGPVPSRIYDLTKTERNYRFKTGDNERWEEFFETDGYNLLIRKDPGTDELTEYEKRKLREIVSEHDDLSQFDLSDFTHEFPEWKKNDPGNSSRPISLRDILNAIGRSEDVKQIYLMKGEDRTLADLFED